MLRALLFQEHLVMVVRVVLAVTVALRVVRRPVVQRVVLVQQARQEHYM
jgi:hypothetical protein